MLPDVIAEWNEWPGELETITGFTWEEYRALDQRLAESDAELQDLDEAMLTEAAKQFFGYPGMTTTSVETTLGARWEHAVDSAFLKEMKI